MSEEGGETAAEVVERTREDEEDIVMNSQMEELRNPVELKYARDALGYQVLRRWIRGGMLRNIRVQTVGFGSGRTHRSFEDRGELSMRRMGRPRRGEEVLVSADDLGANVVGSPSRLRMFARIEGLVAGLGEEGDMAAAFSGAPSAEDVRGAFVRYAEACRRIEATSELNRRATNVKIKRTMWKVPRERSNATAGAAATPQTQQAL